MGKTITVPFHGTDLLAIVDEERILVPLRPLVVGMGLDWGSQLQRVKRDPILGRSVVMTTTENDRQAVSLPLRRIPGFLFRIDAVRIKDLEVRAKVLDFQDGAYDVLADACLGKSRQLGDTSPAAEILPPAPIAGPDVSLSLRLVSECRKAFGVPSARELWFHLGLPRTAAMMAGPRQADLFTYRREA